MSFVTKTDFSDNRQVKQFQLSNTQLSGTTTFGVDNASIPLNFTGDTINIDALQYIRTRGLIIPSALPTFTGTTFQILGRDNDTGKVIEADGSLLTNIDATTLGGLSNGQFLRSDENDIMNGSLTVTGSVFTSNVVIDPLSSNTNIANSILTVKNTVSSDNISVGQFTDINRNNTTAISSVDHFANVNRIQSNSTFSDGVLIGSNNVSRKLSSGSLLGLYGVLNESSYQGSGDVGFLVSNVNRIDISGSGVGIINYVRGLSPTVTVNNSNITANFVQGAHISVQHDSGTIGQSDVLYLDIDSGSVIVTGDLAYIRAGNDALPTVSGNSYFIKSETILPSEFSGSIKATSFIKSGATSDDILLGNGSTTSLSQLSSGGGGGGGGGNVYTADGTSIILVGSEFRHADTSSQNTVSGLTDASVINGITLDGFGHITSISTRLITLNDVGYFGDVNANNYSFNVFVGSSNFTINEGENLTFYSNTNILNITTPASGVVQYDINQSNINTNNITNGAGFISSFDITTQTDSKYLRSDISDSSSGTITAVNFILSSDERLKTNIKKAQPTGYRPDWKTFEMVSEKGQLRYGEIAQEVEKLAPQFVRTDSNGLKSVAYIDMLICENVEMRKENQELKNRLDKLEEIVNKLI